MAENYHSHFLFNQTRNETSNIRTSTPIRPNASNKYGTNTNTRHNGNAGNLHQHHHHRGNTYNNNTQVLSSHHTVPTTSVEELLHRVNELQSKLSQLALENEELQFELNQAREENEHLQQTLQAKELIQEQMKQQMETVTEMAYTMYNKFAEVKCRYHKEKLNGPIDGVR